MIYSTEMIRRIAERKFGVANKKEIEEYVKRFDIADPVCQEDVKAYEAEREQDETIERNRQQFRNDNYFINKFIYDFATGEIKVYASVFGNRERTENAPIPKDPMEARLFEWVKSGFAERPMKVEEGVSYADAVSRFSEKYGVHMNHENVATSIKEIARLKEGREEAYRAYYRCMFASAFCQVPKEDQGKIDEICRDFESVMEGIREAVTGIEEETPAMTGRRFRFGVMKREELREFLTSFREPECNLTEKAMKNVGGLKGKELADRSRSSVRAILNNKESDREETLNRCVAQLQALKRTHAMRPPLYFLTSPLRHRNEVNAIRDLEQMIVKANFSEDRIKELEGRQSVYIPSYERERENIGKLCESVEAELPSSHVYPLFETDPFADQPELGSDRFTIIEAPEIEEEEEISEPEIAPVIVSKPKD